MTKYPTPWAFGIPRGSINDRKTNYFLRISKGKDVKCYTFMVSQYGSRDACLKKAEKERERLSHEWGLTRNEIRFINKNTIEVKLTQDKTFITDAKNLNVVNKYPLQAKAKKEKDVTRYYVIAQDKKKTFKFSDLLNDYKFVEYINGNTLDLRESNMKEFGIGFKVKKERKDAILEAAIDDEDVEAINEENDDKLIEDFSKYYDIPTDKLPKNKWILGSVNGTIFSRSNEKGKIVTMRIKVDGKIKNKTFKVSDYGSVEKTINEAKIYMIAIAHKYDIVKNKIRIHDDYFEIMLDNEYIVKTDLVFLPLFIPTFDNPQLDITVSKTFSSVGSKIYAAVYIKCDPKLYTFHKFIMGSNMIDHINGDPLDNRLTNLRFTNYSHNNTNRQPVNDGLINGVTYRKHKGTKTYRASIKDNGVQYVKSFNINKYGNDNSKRYATFFRKYIMEISFEIPESYDDIPIDKSDVPIIQNAIKRTSSYQFDMATRIVRSPEKYLYGLEIDSTLKHRMFSYYYRIQVNRIILLDKRIEYLKKLLVRQKNTNTNTKETIEV